MKTKNQVKLDNFQNIKDALLVAQGYWNMLPSEDQTGYAPVQIKAAIASVDQKIKEVEGAMLEAMAVKQAKEFFRNLQTVEIPRTAVTRAYVGRPGCMCGCNGNYHEAGSPMSERVRREVNARLSSADEVDFGKTYVYVRDGRRCWAVYFDKN